MTGTGLSGANACTRKTPLDHINDHTSTLAKTNVRRNDGSLDLSAADEMVCRKTAYLRTLAARSGMYHFAWEMLQHDAHSFIVGHDLSIAMKC